MANFCGYCGKQLEEGEQCKCKNNTSVVINNKPRSGKMKKWIWLVIVAAIAIYGLFKMTSLNGTWTAEDGTKIVLKSGGKCQMSSWLLSASNCSWSKSGSQIEINATVWGSSDTWSGTIVNSKKIEFNGRMGTATKQ